MPNFVNSTLAEKTTIANVSTNRVAAPVAWAQFGKNFDHPVSIQEAIQEAKANYQVEKQPLVRVPQSVIDAIKAGQPITNLTLGKDDIITSHVATTRSDNNITLGVVGSDYGIVQNERAVDFISFIKEISGEEPLIETAGVLGKGERIFVSARLGADCYLSPKDSIKQYVLFTNSHDGTGSVMAFFTPVRVICQNTLNTAIRQAKNKIVFRHTKKVNDRLDQIKYHEEERRKAFEVFSRSVDFSQKFLEQMLNFRLQKVDETYINDFVARMALSETAFKEFVKNGHRLEGIESVTSRTRNIIERLRDSIESGIGQDEHQGTKLWLINGITTYLHNDRTYRTPQDEYRSLIEGDGQGKVQMAYNLLLAPSLMA